MTSALDGFGERVLLQYFYEKKIFLVQQTINRLEKSTTPKACELNLLIFLCFSSETRKCLTSVPDAARLFGRTPDYQGPTPVFIFRCFCSDKERGDAGRRDRKVETSHDNHIDCFDENIIITQIPPIC